MASPEAYKNTSSNFASDCGQRSSTPFHFESSLASPSRSPKRIISTHSSNNSRFTFKFDGHMTVERHRHLLYKWLQTRVKTRLSVYWKLVDRNWNVGSPLIDNVCKCDRYLVFWVHTTIGIWRGCRGCRHQVDLPVLGYGPTGSTALQSPFPQKLKSPWTLAWWTSWEMVPRNRWCVRNWFINTFCYLPWNW
jgi:hypothetical protein